MRFTNLVCLSVLLAVFSSMFTGFYKEFVTMDRKLEALRNHTDSLVFISGSFTALCKGKGFSSFEEWQRVCKIMWQLESIEWEYAGGEIYCGRWNGPYGSGEVFAKKQVMNND